ncbi:hypothetical protein SLEP1_g57610 [Rubroshorea leprosula]|uniref:Uncharacterized protein n=1 Tax=Rubroshorea leprosula TaxID=152421 RepID=A0AAV5MLS6_9ROSI|nr:hypothetical protein SLEP1_g57610 [Rubroshorea leprosula]
MMLIFKILVVRTPFLSNGFLVVIMMMMTSKDGGEMVKLRFEGRLRGEEDFDLHDHLHVKRISEADREEAINNTCLVSYKLCVQRMI